MNKMMGIIQNKNCFKIALKLPAIIMRILLVLLHTP